MRSGRVVNFVLIFNICAIRYNEFHDVYEKLKKAYPSEASSIKFPGKRIIGNNFDPDFIKLRREALHDFTIRLMKVGVAISIETAHIKLLMLSYLAAMYHHIHILRGPGEGGVYNIIAAVCPPPPFKFVWHVYIYAMSVCVVHCQCV